MNKTISNALQDLYLTTTVPFLIIDNNGIEQTSFPKDIFQFYKQNFLETLIQSLRDSSNPEGILLYQLEEFYFCAITTLDKSFYLVTLPIYSSDISNEAMFSSIIRFINNNRTSDLKYLVRYLPNISTYILGRFANLARLIYGSTPTDSIYIKHNVPDESMINTTLSGNTHLLEAEYDLTETLETKPAKRPHHSVHYGYGMESAIIRGDANAFLEEYKKPMIGSLGQMSLNPLQQAKYGFICGIFNISRAAIKGGLPTEYSLELSDIYCQQMDAMNSIQQIDKLIVSAGIDYCNKVKQYGKQNKYSPYTKIVLDYIRRHIFEPIKMEDLTFETSLNRRSLSIYFQKDTGQCITDYITQQRLQKAKQLLTTTNLSIIQISELLCFSSQSYFGKKFKEYQGITPKEYRDSLPV